MTKRIFATAFALLLGAPVAASTFSLDVVGSCGLSSPTVTSNTGFNAAASQQCNNLTNLTSGALLGSRLVGYQHVATFDSIQSSVSAITNSTDIPSISNTGASARIDTLNASDTLTFTGGPSEFELIILLDYMTNVRSTVNSASFVSFSFGAQRIGGSGGMASDSFKVVDYATAVSQEIFDVDPINLQINSGASVQLNAALIAQATSGSLAGQNDNDEALAEGTFSWSIFAPDGVQISSSSGFDYNQSTTLAPVPLPAGGVLLFSSLGLILLNRRRQRHATI